MRHFKHVAVWMGVAVALAACGGGSGTDGGGALLTKTNGNITAVNGQSANVGGVQVQAPSANKSSTSGSDGRFDLGDLPAASIEIVVTAPGNAPDTITVDLSGGGRATLHLTIDEDGVARMSMEHCDGDGGENETRVALTPLQPGLKGKIEIEQEADGDMKFEVEAEHLAAGQTVDILITDDGNVTENLGTFTPNSFGEVELEIETENGAPLPFDAISVRDLEGFSVTVRDTTTGDDLLEGIVPVLGQVPTDCDEVDDDDDDDRREGESRLTNAAGVTGQAEVELESRPDRLEEEFEVKVELTNVVGGMEVWLEDPANAGTLVKIGDLALDDDGDWKLEFETDDGDALPFGAAGVADLVGLSIEIRRTSDGTVAYSGTTPPLNAS